MACWNDWMAVASSLTLIWPSPLVSSLAKSCARVVASGLELVVVDVELVVAPVPEDDEPDEVPLVPDVELDVVGLMSPRSVSIAFRLSEPPPFGASVLMMSVAIWVAVTLAVEAEASKWWW